MIKHGKFNDNKIESIDFDTIKYVVNRYTVIAHKGRGVWDWTGLDLLGLSLVGILLIYINILNTYTNSYRFNRIDPYRHFSELTRLQ